MSDLFASRRKESIASRVDLRKTRRADIDEQCPCCDPGTFDVIFAKSGDGYTRYCSDCFTMGYACQVTTRTDDA